MNIVALFGESQKGAFRTAYLCENITQLSEYVGEPPSAESRGLSLAIQTLLFQHAVLFFRVREEGFSVEDYLCGLNLLEREAALPKISALCLPGVGSTDILELSTSVCMLHKSILMITERDLYDYLTSIPS